jgi:hypothetical protein
VPDIIPRRPRGELERISMGADKVYLWPQYIADATLDNEIGVPTEGEGVFL